MTIQVSTSTIPNPEEVGLTAASDRGDAYLTELLSQCQALDLQVIDPEIVGLVQELRDRTSLWLNKLTIPTKRDEEWRFTDLSPLLEVNFQTPNKFDLPESAAELTLPEAPIRLVFVNGVYAPQLSAVADLPEGLVVTNLAGLPTTYRTKIGKYLAQEQGAATEVFTALNTAGLTDAAVVWVARNQQVETPIQLLFISTADETPTVSQPRCLVVAEVGSKLTLIENYEAVGEGVYFTNAVTEIALEENAQVSHTRVERESKGAFHIGTCAIAQARNSRYTCNSISIGSKLSRHNLEVLQTGEQTETTLNGLTIVAGEQLSDTHSIMAYAKPYGTSNQLHKCIVTDKAHAVFNGKVFVPQAAQLTNASQLNRNLLLSPKARIDTKPQLEITADNVKCSHGATVSQLEADEVFYLQSRGLNEADARNLLIDAFAAEIIQKLPVVSLRKQLSELVRKLSD
ncbi:MAG TPA: Fe-S cluster assembly protein SufD [Cyanobacteria bacterium UBA8553]|nr:Fe-S cluster assembly protein SufD [Cyanobacteria bacterium UBA8553]